ncbi:hypothetical protein [Alistipes sp.]|uniref:hypothetical protein n=1 Tax=Alistipes sp. TaxID=1872444 RepID=UPI0031FD28CB
MTIHDILIEAINNLPSTKKLSIGDLFMAAPLGQVIKTLSKKKEEGVHTYPNIDPSLKYRAYSTLKCDGETIYYLAISNADSLFWGLDKRYAFFAITDKGIYCNYEKNSDCNLCVSWTSIKSIHSASRNGGFAEIIQINDIYGNKHELWPVMMGVECKSSIIQGIINWLQNISNRIKQLRITEIFQEFKKEYLRGNYYKAVQLASHIEAMGYEKIDRNKQKAIDQYINNFEGIPSKNRKIIVIDSKFTYLESKLFYVLPCENLPKCIKFSTPPMEGNLYIQHPHIINYYIPYANKKTEIELFESKLRELREILMALGASRIEIIHDRKYLTQKERETSFKADVDGHYQNNKIHGGGEYVNECNSYEELAHRYETIFTNDKITHAPYVSTDLIWLKTEPEWQSLINKRMKGEFTSASFCVSNNELNRLDKRTEAALMIDFSNVLTAANINANYDLKEMFNSQESITWRLNVEFVPLNTVTKESKRQKNATDTSEKKIKRHIAANKRSENSNCKKSGFVRK